MDNDKLIGAISALRNKEYDKCLRLLLSILEEQDGTTGTTGTNGTEQ